MRILIDMQKRNFHIDLYKETLLDYVPCERELSDFKYVLCDNDPMMAYKSLTQNATKKKFVMQKTISHRRRRFIGIELYFFIDTRHLWINLDHVLVIFTGMSVNRHILYLWSLLERAGLMNKFEWHIYDKEEFHVDVVKYASLNRKNIKLFDEYFTEETAEFYASTSKMKIMFICNSRNKDTTQLLYHRGDIRNHTYTQEFTNTILASERIDAEVQKHFYLKLKPICALLKYNISLEERYEIEQNKVRYVEYLAGKFLFNPWDGFLAYGSRLIVTNNEMKTYDLWKLFQQRTYHNYVTRLCSFKTDKPEYRDYCPCWSCTYECSIIRDFHKTFNIPYSKNNFYEETSAVIDKLIGRELFWEWTYESGETMDG